MSALWQFINGNKTYIIGAATVAYGALGYALGYMDQAQAMEMVMLGLGMMGLRHGIAKMQ